ncbi:2,3-diphosphoglycerate-dependent phosphoglycerate mutase [Woodsholea maritima]|uniref:2,3-diphosphoglycerate-dependent phosphoglycerate mutase n=1 Tax=Woodsholea maritima TaxID=240237 RepID=UPI00037ADA70|nr:2,3-diphosphoglycerate-dependent phosphoglycerate mutase [Woodsholea maritima]
MTRLVLLRHGQSEWNLENRFTGWVDVNLTAEGEAQARQSGQLMKDAGFAPTYAFASYLKRAIRTCWLSLEELDRVWIPVEKHWRLNERHYGLLTGLNKSETAQQHGEDMVHIWRRSYDTPPPALPLDDERHARFDPRYSHVDVKDLPLSESLKTTLERVAPYWENAIAPKILAGEDVIIAAHGNSLRALVKMLFQLDQNQIMEIEAPTGNPLLIEMEGLRPVDVRYLDEDRATGLPPIPAAV